MSALPRGRMRIAHERGEIPGAGAAGRVATIGVFDGVHIGHAAILAETVRQAREANAEAAVVTFRTHPREVVSGASPPSICSLEQRLERFEAAGIDLAIALPFDAALRETTAEDFLDRILGGEVGARALVLGHDARFGRDRRGDAALARARGWRATVVEPVVIDGVRASSGAVRAAIAAGRVREASRLLGHPVVLRGTVVRGDGRGRALGFATANLELHHDARPPRGVYAGSVDLEGRRAVVVNVGIRPTFGGPRETVEAHVPGWTADLYGRVLDVEIAERIRDERRFDSPEALARQIALDVERAVALHAAGAGPSARQ